eukprot:3713186-Prymnesium_polylepis.1
MATWGPPCCFVRFVRHLWIPVDVTGSGERASAGVVVRWATPLKKGGSRLYLMRSYSQTLGGVGHVPQHAQYNTRQHNARHITAGG